MNGFLWASGHLGWGIFSVAVFSCLWWLLADLCWRLRSIRISRLAAAVVVGWIIGIGLIVLAFHLASR